jgi:hypothetical protein
LYAKAAINIQNKMGLTSRQEAVKGCVSVFEHFEKDPESLKGMK